jgi:RNA recognition motif-containing protein
MAAPFAASAVAKKPKDAVEEQQPSTSLAIPSTTSLYVANVPYDASEGDIRNWFQEQIAGAGSVTNVRSLLGPDGKPKGAAIITCDSLDAAGKVLSLDGKAGLEGRLLLVKEDMFASAKGEGKGRLKRAAKSDSKGEKGSGKSMKGDGKAAKDGRGTRPLADRDATDGTSQGAAGDGRSVVLKNLAFNATEANIGELFAGCGEVSAVRIAKDSRNGRSRGFAVVEFTNKDSIAEALRRNGQLVRGRAVRIEAMGEASTISSDSKLTNGDHVPKSTTDVDAAAVREQGIADSRAQPIQFVKAADADEKLAGDMKVTVSEPVESAVDADPDSLRKHAQTVVAQMKASQLPEKRGRGEKPAKAEDQIKIYPDGEAGLHSACELLSSHDTVESLLASTGAEELKGRLLALGLKSGGSPLERAHRLLRLKGCSKMEDIPRDLLAKGTKRTEGVNREPIKFVKAGAADENPPEEQ